MRRFNVTSLTLVFAVLFTAVAYAEPAEKIVKEIEIVNNKIVSEQTILSKLQTKKGEAYSPVTLSDDIKRLYATGLFNDVSADIAEVEGGLKVTFKVQEKPVLDKIILKGNRRIRTRNILAEMKTRKKEILDRFKLKEDIESIKKLYAKKGYSLADISYDIQEKENKVTVTINITEGNQIRIRKINFVGNKTFRGKRLLKLIKTKRKGWFNSGFYKKDVLEEDIDRIVSFYHQEGYIDAKVTADTSYDQRKVSMFVTFIISEGKQYKVSRIKIGGNSVFSQEQLKEGLEMRKGAVYSEGKLRMDTAKIQTHYFDEGYISASVKADTVFDTKAGLVDLSYDVKEGGVAYVDKINIGGNDRTKDVVIRREMRLFPGDRYNGEKLRRSRQRLYNLGYFEEVTFDTADEPTTLPDKYDLDVFVKETKTGEFSFGAGYSSIDQFIGFIDLTQKNFDIFNFPKFCGAGQKLRIHTEFGSTRKDYELTFIEPWFLGYPVNIGFSLYSRTRDWDKYEERREGGDVFIGREFGEYWSSRLIYTFEGIRITDIAFDASDEVKIEDGKHIVSSLRGELVRDTRDNKINPSSGLYDIFSCEYGGGIMGGDKDFVKYETVDHKYFPVSKDSVFELRGRVGLVEAFGGTPDVPIYERFYAGGADTIRGYKERRVGPEGRYGDPVGGRIRAVFNAEYTYTLTESLKWAFFYDIGNVWADYAAFDWSSLKLKSSIGTGARVKTPLGPIRLDYGYALNPSPGDARGRFHFSMSQEF